MCTDRWKYIVNLHPEFAFTTHIDLPGNLGQRGYFSTWESEAESNSAAAEVLRRYHARPGEELYDLAADPHELHNLAGDPQAAPVLGTLRTRLEAWLQAQGDQRTVFGEPRLLSDPDSYGSGAPPGNVPRRNR
jgi:arylsulfatase A-like enzyme